MKMLEENLAVDNPCPTCGRRFDFPLTGCMTYVAQFLLAGSNGNCPDCGTRVVGTGKGSDGSKGIGDVDGWIDPLSIAASELEKRRVRIVDIPVSVRCRNTLHKAGMETVDDLLNQPLESVRDLFIGSPGTFAEIEAMVQEHGMAWNSL